MGVALPAFFTFATVVATWSAWRAIAANLPEIRALHRQVTGTSSCDEIVVTLRPVTAMTVPAFPARRSQRRPAQPKPVTHRLHHFGRPAIAC